MMICAEIGTTKAIIEVCRHHLGRRFVEDIEPALLLDWPADLENDEEDAPISLLGWITDLDFARVTEKSAQTKAVNDIQESLAKALRAFYSLHPDLRQAIEWQVAKNLASDDPATRLQTVARVDSDLVPFKSLENFEVLTRTALAAFIGVSEDTPSLEVNPGAPGKSAKSTARNLLSSRNMNDLTRQQRGGETWQKAMLVKQCRALWQMANDTEPPRTHSGAFGRFLDDFIEALGKQDDWGSGAATMRAWASCAKKDDWFLRGSIVNI